MRDRLRVVRAEAPTLRRLRFGMQRLSRTMRVCETLAAHAQQRAAALSGADVRVHKAYWKIVAGRPRHAVHAQLGELAYEWSARSVSGLGGPRRPTPQALAEIAQHACAADPPAPPDSRWSAYVAALPLPSPLELVMVEDKDPSSGVLVDARMQAIRGRVSRPPQAAAP